MNIEKVHQASKLLVVFSRMLLTILLLIKLLIKIS